MREKKNREMQEVGCEGWKNCFTLGNRFYLQSLEIDYNASELDTLDF